MKLRSRTRPGFTLVEMIVVIVMMSILAAAGLVGFGAMVSHFTRQSCIASRREAVQAYVSDWMQGRSFRAGIENGVQRLAGRLYKGKPDRARRPVDDKSDGSCRWHI